MSGRGAHIPLHPIDVFHQQQEIKVNKVKKRKEIRKKWEKVQKSDGHFIIIRVASLLKIREKTSIF